MSGVKIRNWIACEESWKKHQDSRTDPFFPFFSNGGTLRISIPESWQSCRFDAASAATYSGNASNKVGAANFTSDWRTLSIPVTADFATNDTLTVSDLKLAELRLVRPGSARLELAFTGNPLDVYDLYPLEVRVLWLGGDYGGWDCQTMTEAVKLHWLKGTMITAW